MAQEEQKAENNEKVAAAQSNAKKLYLPPFLNPMLASPTEKAFTREGWIYEPKLDGIRALAYVTPESTEIFSRNGRRISAQYPALAAALPQQVSGEVILDGEIVALNSHGRPSLQMLQQRMNLLKLTDIKRAEERIPVHFFVFDILHADGNSLLRCPLLERKELLRKHVHPDQRIVILKYFEDNGVEAYQVSVDLGFEGIVAKRALSHYEVGRRSPSWVKVKALRSGEFLIAGYSPGQGSRSAWFGSLVLAYYDDDNNLTYAGSVGTGFDTKLLNELLQLMKPLEVKKCPFKKRPDDKKDAIWVKPELVAEIKFMDWSADKHLRDPVFLHLRSDIEPMNVRVVNAISNVELDNLEELRAVEQSKFAKLGQGKSTLKVAEATSASAYSTKESSQTIPLSTSETGCHFEEPDEQTFARQQIEFLGPELKVQIDAVLNQLSGKELKLTLRSAQHDIPLTNLTKILFPALDGQPAITKRDFLKLIATLSPLILTQIAHRPLTMIRAPSGIRARNFFQKHWHLDLPDFFETVQLKDEQPAKKDYIVCNNLQTLLFLAQHNIIEYHTFLSRCQPDMRLYDLPDYLVFDIDYHKEDESVKDKLDREAFKKTREAAHLIHETLKSLGLTAFVKTSGRNGLHIYVPIKTEFDFDDVKTLSETIAKHIERDNSSLINTNSVAARNQKKVFLDYHANSKGRSIAVPYTPRLAAQATVSTPITWEELDRIYPDELNQHTIRDRLLSKGDIWKDMAQYREDLSRRFMRRS
ncbi:MAG: DNA ligase D [Candidatus Obscuribacterales bacterium]|nr:DNA ligase D [Candidatus Obscuribacterales bacterium]